MRRIAHISDLHFGALDTVVAEGLVADLAEVRPDLLVVSGDFTQRARSSQFRDAAAYIARLPTPQLVVPGNHDVPLGNIVGRFSNPLRNYRRLVTEDLAPVYEDAQIIVMGLNTARAFTAKWNGFWKDGRISAAQLRGVATRAAAAGPDRFKVVVTHHPFVPMVGRKRSDGLLVGGRRAIAALSDAGIDLVLAGHLHAAYHRDVQTHFERIDRSILSIQAGTATSTRRRRQANAWNMVTIDPDGRVTVAVHVWNGTAFALTTTATYRRVTGTWTAC